MFHSKKLSHRIDNIHERPLRLIYKDKNFDELLVKSNSFRIRHRNMQKLAAEILKVKINIVA